MTVWRSGLILLPLMLVACRTANAPKEMNNIAPNGAVSAKLLADPNAPSVELGPEEEFVKPQLLPSNPSPIYPIALLPMHLTPHAIAVRVTFKESGEVSEITASPVAQSTEDEYRPLFEAAVRDAVSQWKCWPSRIRKFRPGPDLDGDGKSDYRILVSERLFKTFFDVAFSFEIVNGKPAVKRAQ